MVNKELIDTHSHLYLEDFNADIQEVISRAEGEGVTKIYMPALNSAHLQDMLNLENIYPGRCIAMAGLHPCYVKDDYQQELEIIRTLLKNRRFAAIGEIGLDYYWDRSFDDFQMIAFTEQISMAREYGLPIVIHSRSSMDETIKVLKEYKPRGIFHCFSGNLQNAEDIIDCGMVLGIGGVVTYKNAGLDKVIVKIPLGKIVLETDAPYLTPAPFRGKRNESSYLKYIVAKIAEVKNISEEEVATVTTATARNVFRN
jgi:TatD DNase family protein